jgi:hypothetical protein
MIGASLLAGLITAPPVDAGQLVFANEIVARGEVLTLGQVADVRKLPANLRAQAAALPLMVRGPGGRIEHRQLASRARSLMPALAPWLRGRFEGRLTVASRDAQPAMPMASCDGSEDDVATGDVLAVRITVGPFLIERNGVAMQDARPGERLFIRTADGNALVVQCKVID